MTGMNLKVWLLALSCGLWSAVGPVAAELVDRIVAVVNDQIITQSEVQQMAKAIQAAGGMGPAAKDQKGLEREMLESLIDRKLAQEEAKRRGITLSEREMDKALSDFMQRNQIPNSETLVRELGKAGITLKEFKEQLADQIRQERLVQVEVGGKVSVSEAEVRRFYDDHAPKGGTQVHLRMIAVPFPPGATEAQKGEMLKKAEVIVQEMRHKGPLDSIIQKHAVPGQDLGFIDPTDLDPTLAQHLKQLKAGEIAVVQTPQGYQLVQFMGQKTGQSRSFEEVAPQIRAELMRREMEKRFSEWVKTLRTKAHIKIMP